MRIVQQSLTLWIVLVLSLCLLPAGALALDLGSGTAVGTEQATASPTPEQLSPEESLPAAGEDELMLTAASANYYNNGINLTRITTDCTYTDSAGSSAKAVWDYDSLTLTLTGGTATKPMTITGDITLPAGATMKVSGVVSHSGSYTLRGKGDMTLVLNSGCSYSLSNTANGALETGDWNTRYALTISGSGSLDISGYSGGIRAGDLSIRGGTITIGCSSSYGIQANNLTMTGGNVTVSAGTNTSLGNRSGIYSYNISISGGELYAEGQYGIECTDAMTVSGGTVTGSVDELGGSAGIRIHHGGSLTISGGTVTAIGTDPDYDLGLNLWEYQGQKASLTIAPAEGKQILVSAGTGESDCVRHPYESESTVTSMDYLWFQAASQTKQNNSKGYYNSGLDVSKLSTGGCYTDKNGGDGRVVFNPVEKTLSFSGGTAEAPLTINKTSGAGLTVPGGLELCVDGAVSITGSTQGIYCSSAFGFSLSFGSGDSLTVSGPTAVQSGALCVSGPGTLDIKGSDYGFYSPSSTRASAISGGALVSISTTPAEDEYGYSVYMDGTYGLSLTDSTLTAENAGKGHAIRTDGSISATGSRLTARCTSGYGIFSYGTLKATDSQLDVSGTSGMYVYDLILNGGCLTAVGSSFSAISICNDITATNAVICATAEKDTAISGDNANNGFTFDGCTVTCTGQGGIAYKSSKCVLDIRSSCMDITAANGRGLIAPQIIISGSSLSVSAAGESDSGSGYAAIHATAYGLSGGTDALSITNSSITAQSEKGSALYSAAESTLLLPGGSGCTQVYAGAGESEALALYESPLTDTTDIYDGIKDQAYLRIENGLHNWSDWTYSQSPTCTESGAERRDCLYCDCYETRDAAALGHDEVTDEAVEPTCTEAGLTEGSHCDRCGEPIVAQEEVPSPGHDEVTDEAVEPTCTEAGLTEGSHCDRCGEPIVAQEEVPAPGHSWSDWAESKAPSYTETGEEQRSCPACGETETRSVDKLRPAAPSFSISTSAASGKPRLTWPAVEGAVRYEIWRATSKNGTFYKYYSTKGTTYTNTTAQAGKTYYYKVRAMSEDGEYSDFSTVKNMTCDCARPSFSISCVAATGKPRLSWSAVDGAERYEVWRAYSADGTYYKMGSTTGTAYTNTSAKAGTTYYYKIYAIGSSSYSRSAASTVKNMTCDCAQPVVSIGTSTAGKPRLSWSAVEGAVRYEVWRAYSADGTYYKMGTTTGTTYTNTSAKTGTTYYFKVRAIGSSSYATSAYSTVRSITCR